MKRIGLLYVQFLVCGTLFSQPIQNWDYWSANRTMIKRGVQAILMCNGLFTSDRSLDQVFDQELRYLKNPVGDPTGGDYTIDWDRKGVAIGTNENTPVLRAAYREGFGCIILSPDQTFDDIDALPELKRIPQEKDQAQLKWPMGDIIDEQSLPDFIDSNKLEAARDWAFQRPTDEQVTLSLIVVHKGQIILEDYAPGVDMHTRTRTWSTAKSIASTLIGMLVDQGMLALDAPLDIEWLPESRYSAPDPREAITLRHVLNMSSGLMPVDNANMEYATGSGLAYWAGASSVDGARARGLYRTPGTSWDYENYDTILGVLAMKRAFEEAGRDYHTFPYEALLDVIGMHNTILSVDRFGDFILSSQVYTNARDLARFGLLYLNNGRWNDRQVISKDWIDFVRTPAPSTADRGNFYGGQWWLVPDDRTDVPRDAYSTAGNRGQYTIVVPSHDLVIVRRGLDYGRQGFNRWDLLREVLKAFPEGGE